MPSFPQPPRRVSRDYFLNVLHEVKRRKWPTRIYVAEALPGENRAGDAPVHLHPCNRLILFLDGEIRYDLMLGRRRRTMLFRKGDCLFLPGMGWNIPHFEMPHLSISVVFPRGFVRFAMVNHSRKAGPRIVTHPSPWAWNTTHAMGSPGADLLKAIETLSTAPTGDAELAKHVALALLNCSIRHLENDSDHPRTQQPKQIWKETISYLNSNYTNPSLTRARVAEAMGVHPNYLSALASKESNGFHRTLESIRMTRANHMLRQGSWSIKEIASQCGFANTAHFSHAYRRLTGVAPRKAMGLAGASHLHGMDDGS